MHVFYKCRCQEDEVCIAVPERRRGSDLMMWMEMVQHCIGVDHRGLSPMCDADAMEYCKIPSHPEGVGYQPISN